MFALLWLVIVVLFALWLIGLVMHILGPVIWLLFVALLVPAGVLPTRVPIFASRRCPSASLGSSPPARASYS